MLIFCRDRKVLIGIGIGLIVASIAIGGLNINKTMTRAQIEEKAKSYGMDYPSESKFIITKEVGK